MDSTGIRERHSLPMPSVSKEEEVVQGKTPDGILFHIPQTKSMISLFDPRIRKSYTDIITLVLLGLQVLLYATVPTSIAKYGFLLYFAIWRLAYNAGLGYVLDLQSQQRWIVRLVQSKGWMDENKRPLVTKWIKAELRAKMGQDYDFEGLPVEYHVWIMFRHFVDVILLNDFTSYCFFAFSFLQFPPGHSNYLHLLRWIGGITLILFNLWVKVDAHRIVKDYAWYWGDAFFASMQELVFDGVFEFAPHPMYSVGYAGFYGLSLICASETVLFVSLAAHACQFGFLVYFENPHIERTYETRKPLAARTPLDSNKHPISTSAPLQDSTRHDLDNRYFAKDLILLRNFDIFRNKDFVFALIILYSISTFTLPSLSANTVLYLAFAHALLWRLFHTFGLGFVLKAQSDSKFIIRHFIKHYHFEKEGAAVEAAFENWKATYNLSLCMSYTSFCFLAFQSYDSTVGTKLIRFTLGSLLILLHIWATHSTFSVLGNFGWFYGDFFIENYPTELYYTGIYRFLNNPERSMGGAAFFGLAIISGSKLVLVQAVIAVLSHWWFLSVVENSHMKKIYGKALRKDAGITKTLKTVARRNSHVLGGITRGVKGAQDSFEKVLEETSHAVDDFLQRSTPKLQAYIDDTQFFLKQSGERLVISRTANISNLNTSEYELSLSSSVFQESIPHSSGSNAGARFHLGEPITVTWIAPPRHSKSDWVGIYRVNANKSKLVTRVSSQGRWLGVTGQIPAKEDNYLSNDSSTSNHSGTVTFNGKQLPWTPGKYEIRYHHDGLHNVMAISPIIEIFVEHVEDLNDLDSIKSSLALLVARTLSFDQSVIPASTYHLTPSLLLSHSSPPATPLSDPDDFVVFHQDDAQHLATAIDEAFGVELTSEVVVQAANVAKLAFTIYQSKRLLQRDLGDPQSELHKGGIQSEEGEVGELKPERLK